MSTGSGRYSNWANCKFTPAGGGLAIPVPGVTNASLSRQSVPFEASGDGDFHDTTVEVVGLKQSFSVTSNKPDAFDLIPAGAKGTFYIERWDSANKGAPGGGGKAYTLQSTFMPDAQSGTQRTAHTGAAKFMGWSADGVTNPLAVAAL